MSYERNFYNQFQQLSNPNSQYYQKAYSNLRNTLNASSPTTNSLLGIQMAMGGSYKGSLAGANKQRKAIETRNSEAAMQGNNQLFVNSQGQAMNALQGAQSAYEYEDSQPGFWDYLASPLATLAGAAAPGIGAGLGSLFGGMFGNILPKDYGKGGQSASSYGQNTSAPVGYKNVPSYKPFNY